MKKLSCYVRLLAALVGSVTLIIISLIGYSTFNSIPEMPETGLKDEPCTLDEAIARHESIVQENKMYLDQLLESAELSKISASKFMMESSEQLSYETESESESESETESESESETESYIETETEIFTSESNIIETSESETNPPYIYQPVNSMMSPDLQAWVYAYCKEQGVDPFIVMAICERESCCIANIYGDNGRAYGIMQVQVRWVQDKLQAHGYSNEDMLYAQNNIVIGVEILKDHINTGNGMWWAVMAYNGGPQMAGSPATQEYASWVFARAEELRGCPL